MKNRIFTSLALILILMLTLTVTACGAGAKDSAEFLQEGSSAEKNFGYNTAPESQELGGDGSDSGSSKAEDTALKDAKLIYNAYLVLETKEFNNAAEKLDSLVKTMGGYFQEQNINNYSGTYKSGYYIVRVPIEKYDEFLTKTGEICNISSKNQSIDNVTESYYDIDSRLSTAKIKLERLQELLSKADTMADIITIEAAISETEYSIDSLSGSLRSYDNLIDFATVTVELNEVYKYRSEDSAPLTFGQRILNALVTGTESAVEGLADLIVWITYNWAKLLIIAIVIFVIVKILKKRSLSLPFPRSRKKKASSAVNSENTVNTENKKDKASADK